MVKPLPPFLAAFLGGGPQVMMMMGEGLPLVFHA